MTQSVEPVQDTTTTTIQTEEWKGLGIGDNLYLNMTVVDEFTGEGIPNVSVGLYHIFIDGSYY
ncbi:hypothetical protein IH992_06120 [Candidatus Poribacteria bacterium]|nr:hypothetical protein [Candidatus Poribacteria bacterium]